MRWISLMTQQQCGIEFKKRPKPKKKMIPGSTVLGKHRLCFSWKHMLRFSQKHNYNFFEKHRSCFFFLFWGKHRCAFPFREAQGKTQLCFSRRNTASQFFLKKSSKPSKKTKNVCNFFSEIPQVQLARDKWRRLGVLRGTAPHARCGWPKRGTRQLGAPIICLVSGFRFGSILKSSKKKNWGKEI